MQACCNILSLGYVDQKRKIEWLYDGNGDIRSLIDMQNQDMQFADPEWRPPQQTSSGPGQQDSSKPQPINVDHSPRSFNTDPREQPQNTREYNEAGPYGDFGAQKIGTPQFGQKQN